MQPYDVFAVQYAVDEKRSGTHCFIGGDPHEGPGTLAYYVWAIVGGGRTWVVDTGMTRDHAESRGRTYLRTPAEGLATIGIDAQKVGDVIVTHMHWDHVGTWEDFPKADFHLQDKEIAHATGRYMSYPTLNASYYIEDVVTIVRDVYKGRVRFHDGADELAPGITVHLVGGHARGLQMVRVWTRRGWVVLASDAAHLYENMEAGRPFPIVYNLAEMVEGWDTCRKLAQSGRHIVPGHDPDVMNRYPAVAGAEGIAVRLDVDPTE